MTGPAPIAGIQGLSEPTPFATAEERLGGTADPRHGVLGEVASPYPWEMSGGVQFSGEHGPYGLENALLGFDYADDVDPAGALHDDPTADMTPRTHAAPWPKGVPMSVGPDTVADRRIEAAGIHASDTGAGRRMLYSPTMDAQQDKWTDFYDVEPGTSLQGKVPSQVGFAVAGFGSRDRKQSLAGQNEYGFDSSHAHRRYATGSIPGNYMYLQPGGRPMNKTFAGPARLPTGADSPFTGDSGGAAFGQYGAVLSQLPGEYVAPPEPALTGGRNAAVADPGPVEWF